MLPEIKKLWLDALRSGEYKQNIGSLRQVENGQECFCALGVLCEIALKHGVEGFHHGPDRGYYVGRTADGNYENHALPKPVREWAGDNAMPYIVLAVDSEGKSVKEVSIAKLNDRCELTFSEIADMLEKEPERETRD
jgi:hypothetical protein